MKDLYIIGAGDTGREIVDLVRRINSFLKVPEWIVRGFIDDDESKLGCYLEGIPVLGSIEYINDLKSKAYVICSVGNSKIKEELILRIDNKNVEFATLIDPSATICNGASIEEGSFVFPGVVLAINTKIGKHVYLSTNCSIGHDTVISDYSSVFPGVNVSGKVNVMNNTVLGTGAIIIQGLTIGSGVTIGAGSVVIRDIDQPGVYVGSPVRRIK